MKLPTISLICASLLAAGAAQAAKYNITELPLLPGGTFATGSGINKAGQVVGTADDIDGNPQAIVWTNGVATLVLGVPGESSSGTAINSSGVVIGAQTDIASSLGGVFARGPGISTDFSGDLQPSVAALNDSNVIVGTLNQHPAVWATGIIDFGPPSQQGLPNTTAEFFGQPINPNGINAAGVVVGEEFDFDATDPDFFTVAVRWTPAPGGDIASRWSRATAKVLQGLGGKESDALAVNNNGWIVGWARLGNGLQHAALWEPTTSAFDLGTLGGHQSMASGINSMGDVVGTAQVAGGAWHAVVWTHKHFVPIDLNREIGATAAKKFTLTAAVGTNDRCKVLANGLNNKTGKQATFVLSLTDPSLCNNP